MTLDDLMGIDFGRTAPAEGIQLLGLLIDAGTDGDSEPALERATQAAITLRDQRPDGIDDALLYYFQSNAWSALRSVRHASKAESEWDWEVPELEQQVIALRSAKTSPGYEHLSRNRKCQIYTNLAGALSTVGRATEAIECWSQALDLNSKFAMAMGNMAHHLVFYISYLYDQGHQQIYARFAHSHLTKALSLPLESHAVKSSLHSTLDWLKSLAPAGYFGTKFKLREHSMGKTKKERTYREWCLNERLFLNPINDILRESVAAHDILNLPTMRGTLADFAKWVGLFNAMKQEFIAARVFLFKAYSKHPSHYSDKHVQFSNPLRNVRYGLAIEQTKVAFRLSYSILDKIALFINSYFQLSVNANRVYFRTIWHNKCLPEKGVRPELSHRKNLPLRGLFWVAKDLDEKGVFHESLEPDARQLGALRNALEHRFVQTLQSAHEIDSGVAPPDELCFDISYAELNAKAMRMLRKARAALTYLSLAVHVDQRHQNSSGDDEMLEIENEVWRDAT
ncbi:MAG: LA2681 family HEPN domain-containing protein [Gemmatimonadota bacterium]|nr:LA2681 family HEPN domain-containing protein [Gemmatimonadota bacterium]